MPMSTPVAVARVARAIQTTEQSFSQAVLDTSSLIGELTLVRSETGIEPAAGQAAFLRLAKAQALLIEAQTEVLRAHGVLSDYGRERSDIPDTCPPIEGFAADKAAA